MKHFKFKAEVVTGTCPTCEEFPMLVGISKDFYRPAEVNILLGDSSKTRLDLDWQPKVTFKELVAKMVKWDLEKAKEKKAIPA